MGSIDQPENLNAMYLLAVKWLKTADPSPTGLASTFAMKLDLPEKPKPDKSKRNKEKEQEKAKTAESEKPKRDPSKVKCFACGQRGHYANKCPNEEGVSDDIEPEIKRTFAAWDETSTFVTYQVFDAAQEQEQLTIQHVLLDNGADISVFHLDLLRDVQKNTVTIKVNGLGGRQLLLTDEGYLPDFFTVYASENTAVNVLSLADVEDVYPITYNPRTSFIVHLPDRDIVFTKRGKHYIADCTDVVQVYATAVENEQLYTKAEIKSAKEAYDFLKNSGYPSQEEAVHILQDGNIFGLPHFTREDIQRAYDIYGTPPEYVHGKMTAQPVGVPQ